MKTATMINGDDFLAVVIDGKEVLRARTDNNLGDWFYHVEDLLKHFGCSVKHKMDEPEKEELDSVGDRNWEPEAIANLRAIGKLKG